MDYTKWDTVENWKLTNRGEKEVEAFIRELKQNAKRSWMLELILLVIHVFQQKHSS